ncbi:LysE/ArgO family amino acid transporter [uncultured Corynebacterium sp.]|uniref:LysE/ArgO family amino acid transporter n=1 Tax=uncultured Corynebacterium sp. TaxID=159447 RepID=UPI0025E24FF7|nr:LysE/ArgO family amino acid transporter [uncultured Corynebacterium sp.]
MSIILAGLVLGYSLIVAIGPQNVFLIKQGIRREGITAVILACTISDIFLITAGTAGVGVLVDRAPIVLEILRWGGAAYLTWFALRAFRDALDPDSLPSRAGRDDANSRRRDGEPVWFRPMLTALALTWLNPAAYIDVVVMVGGIANQYGPDDRWLFALGSFIAAATWFPALGYGARALSGPLSKPKVWRWLNVGIGCMLLFIVVRLITL